MTDRTASRLAALSLALVLTLAMLAGIDSLATTSHAGAQLAATAASTTI